MEHRHQKRENLLYQNQSHRVYHKFWRKQNIDVNREPLRNIHSIRGTRWNIVEEYAQAMVKMA